MTEETTMKVNCFSVRTQQIHQLTNNDSTIAFVRQLADRIRLCYKSRGRKIALFNFYFTSTLIPELVLYLASGHVFSLVRHQNCRPKEIKT